MSERGLILLGTDAESLAATPVRDVLGHWSESHQPPVRRLTFDQVLADPDLLDQGPVVWIYLNQPAPSSLFDVIAMIQDRQQGAIITADDDVLDTGAEYRDGVMYAAPDAPGAVMCAMLRTLWQQSDVIQSLKMELRILRAQNGGMASQFDKLDEELRLAAQLQRDMLPKHLPDPPGIDVRVFFRPASYVSGDIYDVIQLDDDHIGIFLADAVGHGVPAALMTVFIKRSLRTSNRSDTGEPGIVRPGDTLEYLNRDLVRHQTGKVRFATAAYGILNQKTLEFTFARAGHPYPMLLRANGETEWLAPEGGLLGIFPEEEFEQITVQLQPGDRIVIYSDGFEVAYPKVVQDKGKKTRIANDDYKDEFEKLRSGNIDEVFAEFVTNIDSQKGSLNQADDLTALLIGVDHTHQGSPHTAQGVTASSG